MRHKMLAVAVLLGMVLSGRAEAQGPVAVSPGGGSGEGVVNQECPTFSWAAVEGAVGYRVAVFEQVTVEVPAYAEMAVLAGPVLGVEIPAPALAWTPSVGQCLGAGRRYVWYVEGVDRAGGGGWSAGKAFGVDLTASAGVKAVVEQAVEGYLKEGWTQSASFKAVKEGITAEAIKEITGRSGVFQPLALEGNTNTFYGFNAGASTTGDNDYDTFIGASAGYSNTTGYFNTFLGYVAGYSNTTGYANTFLGLQAGRWNTTGSSNTFLGLNAGYSNTTGISNTFLGEYAGLSNTTGNYNTFLGLTAGYSNTTGAGNLFLGYQAGYSATGSNRLYIDNSGTTTPLIYGEFDTNKLTINGNLEVIGPDNGLVRLSNVTTDNTTKVSRMVLKHYNTAQLPVYLFGAASTATQNFLAFGGGNAIGNAATQLDLYTAATTTTATGTPRLTIIGNGNVGVGTQSPAYPLQMASGAHVTAGGAWTNASSRAYKEHIQALTEKEATETLKNLTPVTFNYKVDAEDTHAGFIAEDVPALVATKDRKGLSAMDIVAVLTKVAQEQQKVITALSERLAALERQVSLKGTVARGRQEPEDRGSKIEDRFQIPVEKGGPGIGDHDAPE